MRINRTVSQRLVEVEEKAVALSSWEFVVVVVVAVVLVEFVRSAMLDRLVGD